MGAMSGARPIQIPQMVLEYPIGALVTGCVLLSLVALAALYPAAKVGRALLFNTPKREIGRAIKNLHRLKFEGLMQLMQRQVDTLAETTHALDAFTASQTRLIVFVDGLDNCEQDKMVLTLDALDLLFTSRRGAPFAMIIAVDPHIIISAIDHKLAAATLPGTELTGHHYLKNIVNLPFYLQNSGLRHLQERLRMREQDLEEWKAKFLNQETVFGSYMSLREDGVGNARMRRGLSLAQSGTPMTLCQTIIKDDYFSNINPRSMNRIINTLNLTGRFHFRLFIASRGIGD